MRRKTAFRRAFTLLAACALLATAAALFVSCGGGGGKSGSEKEKIAITDQGDVDALLEDLDAVMNSMDADDFSPDQLSDGELGL